MKESVQKQLAATLDEYFAANNFAFTDENQVPKLRKWMELIYLRKRPLVAVDVEAWERNPKKITEIGLAVYDPDHQYHLIMPRVKTLHILVKENKNMTNGRWVPNNKLRFNGGVSYEMTTSQLKGLLNEILTHYLNTRNGVLVGHNIGGDIQWLSSHGVKLVENIDTVDTFKVHRLSGRTGGTLRGLLRRVGIPHLNLHNAANDAYYTLLAAMSYCDPVQRQMFGLDTFVETEPVQEDKKVAAARKKAEKFSDSANILNGHEAPEAVEFIGIHESIMTSELKVEATNGRIDVEVVETEVETHTRRGPD